MLGETRVGIFAKEDIAKGTELSFDYQVGHATIFRMYLGYCM